MMILWNKLKYWLIGVGILVLYLFGYQRGKEKIERQMLKGKIKATENAKKSRDRLPDPNRLDRLHNKYKR